MPSSVRAAVLLLWALVLLSGLTMVLSIVLRDELIATWREGKSTELDPPAFVPVAITMFVVVALLAWVLAVMFRSGHGWARWSIAGAGPADRLQRRRSGCCVTSRRSSSCSAWSPCWSTSPCWWPCSTRGPATYLLPG